MSCIQKEGKLNVKVFTNAIIFLFVKTILHRKFPKKKHKNILNLVFHDKYPQIG